LGGHPLGPEQNIVPLEAENPPPQRDEEILPFEIPVDGPYTAVPANGVDLDRKLLAG
jgi:hypothetical protein